MNKDLLNTTPDDTFAEVEPKPRTTSTLVKMLQDTKTLKTLIETMSKNITNDSGGWKPGWTEIGDQVLMVQSEIYELNVLMNDLAAADAQA